MKALRPDRAGEPRGVSPRCLLPNRRAASPRAACPRQPAVPARAAQPDRSKLPPDWRLPRGLASLTATLNLSALAEIRTMKRAHPPGPAWHAWRAGLMTAVAFLVGSGCGDAGPKPQIVYGERGTHAGAFIRPRAVAIDALDRIYIVDYTARVQVFDRDGHYLRRGWTTPDSRNGRPSGLSIDRDGNLLLSDSHYHCLRVYSPEGVELKKIGGEDGTELGQFGYISDAVQDRDGCYYVAEAVRNQRITKLDSAGKPLFCWGSAGTGPGQFGRIRAWRSGRMVICMSQTPATTASRCSRRTTAAWCASGASRDQSPVSLKYPYDVAFGPGGELYVVEYGNHRVQKFTPEGVSLGCWGGPGREVGRFLSPWALAVDSRGKVHVVDSENHRIQRIDF